MRKQLGLYIHFPFCIQKCHYCDFLSFPYTKNTVKSYLDSLFKEIRAAASYHDEFDISTLFIGGGTPSLMEADDLLRLMEALQSSFHMEKAGEITLEANPGTLSMAKLKAARKSGINRLSLGLQSCRNVELKLLGRIHTYEQFLKQFEYARLAGFDNINIDMMSALPGQTLSDYEETLDGILDLEPEHISAYSLTIEEGTPFFNRYNVEFFQDLPSESCERQMYHLTNHKLSEKGYHRYEISNYAKTGFESNHNMGYWMRKNYLGLGLGAHSLVDNTRFSVPRELGLYLKFWNQPKQISNMAKYYYENLETLTLAAQMEEYMFLGFRLTRGIERNKFLSTFGISVDSVYGEVIKKHIKDKLIEETKDKQRLYLTARGIDISNYVLADFILEGSVN